MAETATDPKTIPPAVFKNGREGKTITKVQTTDNALRTQLLNLLVNLNHTMQPSCVSHDGVIQLLHLLRLLILS